MWRVSLFRHSLGRLVIPLINHPREQGCGPLDHAWKARRVKVKKATQVIRSDSSIDWLIVARDMVPTSRHIFPALIAHGDYTVNISILSSRWVFKILSDFSVGRHVVLCATTSTATPPGPYSSISRYTKWSPDISELTTTVSAPFGFHFFAKCGNFWAEPARGGSWDLCCSAKRSSHHRPVSARPGWWVLHVKTDRLHHT